jgi:hypothetical protein
VPISVPVPDRTAGDVFTETMWDAYIRDNINKLLDRGHRVLTVAQFLALTGLEDGDEVYLEVDATNGIQWHLRYVAADATSHKWRFLGGPGLYSLVATSETTSSATYVALATAGPAIALPRTGDYDIEEGARISANLAGSMSYDAGAAAASDADRVMAIQGESVSRPTRKTGVSGSITAKYHAADGSTVTTFAERWLRLKPVRIRHDA